MKTRPLTPETHAAVLEAAWRLIVERGSLDVTLAGVAAAAGVSRQSVYLGFGGRVGLLTAMARHADERSRHARRMRAISRGPAGDSAALLAFIRAWLMHLPEIYPVGVLLGGAAITDPEAAAVLEDRMVGGLHTSYRLICERLAAAGNLAPGMSPDRAADLAWSSTHIDAWRQLVVERGWSRAAFRRDREALVAGILLKSPLNGSP